MISSPSARDIAADLLEWRSPSSTPTELIRVRTYSVYILASWTRVLYVGVTNNLQRRVAEHRAGDRDGFTARYKVRRLVYVEQTHDVLAAIRREKELKGWSRRKKVALVEKANPTWKDLAP